MRLIQGRISISESFHTEHSVIRYLVPIELFEYLIGCVFKYVEYLNVTGFYLLQISLISIIYSVFVYNLRHA